MGFAISLRSDNPSAQLVRTLWQQVEAFEDKPSMAELGYPPHITLAIYDDPAVSESMVRDALEEVGSHLNAIAFTFDAVRHFDGPPLVLWAAPQPCNAALSIHAAIHRLIDPKTCRLYYRPGTWHPHCTLGTRITAEKREAALSFASSFQDSFEVAFDGLDCISFPPLKPVEFRKLPPSGCHPPLHDS